MKRHSFLVIYIIGYIIVAVNAILLTIKTWIMVKVRVQMTWGDGWFDFIAPENTIPLFFLILPCLIAWTGLGAFYNQLSSMKNVFLKYASLVCAVIFFFVFPYIMSNIVENVVFGN